METINHRAKKIRISLNMTQKEFARKLNLETSNSISMIERGKNSLTEQNIEFICTPYRLKNGITISSKWLRTGEGEMFEYLKNDIEMGMDRLEILTPDERELVSIYRKLTTSNKIVARKQIDVLIEGQDYIVEKGAQSTGQNIQVV